MSTLVAGVDCSTQATKAIVIDVDSGRVLAHGHAQHTVSGIDGVRESNPEQWWDALGQALADTRRSSEIQAIAVAAQQHGLVVLDAGGRPLRAAPLWNDTTSAPDAATLSDELGGPGVWAARVGSVPNASLTVAKWARLRRVEPTLAARAAAVRLPHDFLTERLCGVGVTDRGDASGTGWWTPSEGTYAADVLALERVSLERELLPEVSVAGAPVGTIRAAAAVELGLPSAATVATGTGDNMAGAVGIGLTAGTPALSLGTSGTAFALTERPAADASGVISGFADASRRFLPLACSLNATLAVDRLASWLGLDREQVEPAGEVVVLPYLDGERTPAYPSAAGTIVGLRHSTSPGQILQASYDGVVEGLLWALELLDQATSGVDADAPLLLLGGGARGDAWRATVARLSGRRLLVCDEPDLVALGAAALAAESLGLGDADALARGWMAPPVELEPVARDEDRIRRIRHVRARLHELNADS